MRIKQTVFTWIGIITVFMGCASLASDHTNTEEFFPIEVEDAYPIKYRAFEFEFATRYEDPDEGGGRFVFLPEIKAGAFRNTHIWVQGNLVTDDDEDNSAEFGLLYNFNAETVKTPAFALSPRVETDFSGSTDFKIRGIMTKTFDANRFNINVDYIDIGDPDPGERGSRYFYGLGWDRSIRLDLLLLADVFTRQSELIGEDSEIMTELGIRYQLDPDTLLAAGIGIGLSGGSDSRDFTATVGVQRSF